MTEAYESSFRKITAVADLPMEKLSLFRAAGATIVLRRDEGGVEAIDGSCLSEESDASGAQRMQSIVDCVAAHHGGTSEWRDLVDRAGLPVRIEDGAVWVCVDGCRR